MIVSVAMCKSKGKVPPVLASFYAQWRVRCGAVSVLRDDHDSPPERLLQTIWQHQRLLREQLKTLDGQPVRILHPGFRSVEGGPDFRGAIVQLGDGRRRPATWRWTSVPAAGTPTATTVTPPFRTSSCM
jgi:hypothetical protein